MTDILLGVNSFAWILGNILVAYISVGVFIFVIVYYVLFDPKATTAGKMIFRFFLSLIGIVGLIFIGTFIDPAVDREWSTLPPDVDVWRPILRVFIYGYVAFAITNLAILLVVRKWWPARLDTAIDKDLVKLRHTSDIPIIKD